MRTTLVFAICLLSASALSQTISPTGPDTSYAPCLQGQDGSRYYESAVLTSPDGLWRAHANVESRPGGELGCSNTSRLLVQGPNQTDYQAVYVEQPTRDVLGNGLKLISWSPQGHLLAVEIFQFQYASDDGEISPLVYDADHDRVIEPDMASLFARKFGKKECAFQINNVLGFDPQNRLLFQVDDIIEPGDDEPFPETRCVGGPSVWVLDFRANQLEKQK